MCATESTAFVSEVKPDWICNDIKIILLLPSAHTAYAFCSAACIWSISLSVDTIYQRL